MINLEKEQAFSVSKKVNTRRCSGDVQNSIEGPEEKDDVLNKANETANECTSKDSDIRIKPEDDPFYQRFSPARKHFLVFLVGLSCFLSPSSNMAFLPAVPIIATRFETTSTVINISNAAYTLVMAVSPCIMSPLSDIYGRRAAFLACSLGFTICTVLVAVSQDLAMFFVFRCFTALFGTAFFSVGGSIVGDIYIPQERGNAMGWTLSGSQIGPALAPCIGGLIVTYTSWRVIFGVLAGLGGFNFILSFLFLPETARKTIAQSIKEIHPEKRFVWCFFNPFKVVLALKYGNLVLAGVISSSLLYNMYTLLTPIRHIMDPRFNLTTPIYGSLFYLPPGIGYLCGSFIGGKWADYYVKKYMKKRGKRIPEDRLRSTFLCYAIVLPATILIYGWSLEKEKGGMILPIIAMFLGGVAQTICFPSVNAYCVDSMPQLGGDAIASNYFSRYIAGAVGTATCLTQIDSIGIGWTCTISAFVLFGGFVSSAVLVQWGAKMRERA